jgi:serine/threonine protein kinase
VKPRFGRYKLLGKLATGGMAQLYLARQDGLGGFSKKVVIKRLRASQTKDSALIKMFFSEAALAGRLSHPNVVNVFDFAEAEDEQYIVMEYVEGPSLKRLIKLAKERGRPLPVAHCLKIASQVCEGLAYLQNLRDDRTAEPLNLVHRDITPDNILLARSGWVKIVDFGIAKATTVDLKTQPGVVKGKLAYIAPEQLFNDPTDGRADTYALGVVLYEALTQTSPFARDSDAAIIEALLHHQPPKVTALRPDAPPELDAILSTAMARRRDDRFASPLDLQLALEQELVKLMPVFTAGRLRELVATLDPAPPVEPEETTTSDSMKLPDGAENEPKTDVVLLSDKLPPDHGAKPTGELRISNVPTRPQPAHDAVAPITLDDSDAISMETLLAPPLPSSPPPPPPPSVPPPMPWASPPSFVPVDNTAMILEGDFLAATTDATSAGAPAAPPPRSRTLMSAGFAGIFVLSALAAWGVMSLRAPAAEPLAPRPPPQQPPTAVAAPAPEKPVGPAEPVAEPKAPEPQAVAVALAKEASMVSLTATPAATVWVDGLKVGATPVTLPLDFGPHKVRFESVDAGLNKLVMLRVPKEAEYSKDYTFERATLTVEGPAGALLYVNKRKVASLPVEPLQLYEGTYTLRAVHAESGLDETRTVELKRGDAVERFGAEADP